MSDGTSKNNPDAAIDKPDFVRAIDACLAHADEHYGMTIGEIADAMGMSNKWTLYKWLESGRLPLCEIEAFENACHAKFITRYLADRSGFVLVARPDTSQGKAHDLISLTKVTAEANASIAGYALGQTDKKTAMKAINSAMEALAWQKKHLANEA